jgi:sensor histidine kinase YesM
MEKSNTEYAYYTPKYFWWILFGVWVFLSLSLGFFSDWIFGILNPDSPGTVVEGLIYASVYSFIFISIFGAVWIPLNRNFPTDSKRNVIVHVMVQIGIAITGFVLGNFATGKIHKVFYGEGEFLNDEARVAFAIIALMCLIGILSMNGLVYTLSYVNRSRMLEQSKTESELMALRAQINPHFLFNSLNSIAALVQSSPDQAESVTQDLADLFRFTLRASEKSMVSLSEELELVKLYLNIEEARFKDRLEVEIKVDQQLKQSYTPALILQPLVENAIKHGVSRKEGSHRIEIHIQKEGDWLDIQILDTGPGFPHKNLEQILDKGTGLSNIFKRLNLQFRNRFDLAILDQGIRIRFPHTVAVEKEQAYSYKLNPDLRESYSG